MRCESASKNSVRTPKGGMRIHEKALRDNKIGDPGYFFNR